MSDSINIPHLAQLARLSLSEDQRQAAAADLQNIMAMIDAMQAVPTDDLEPMANPLDATQRLRQDAITESVDVPAFQANAPATEDGYYLVPRVVE